MPTPYVDSSEVSVLTCFLYVQFPPSLCLSLSLSHSKGNAVAGETVFGMPLFSRGSPHGDGGDEEVHEETITPLALDAEVRFNCHRQGCACGRERDAVRYRRGKRYRWPALTKAVSWSGTWSVSVLEDYLSTVDKTDGDGIGMEFHV